MKGFLAWNSHDSKNSCFGLLGRYSPWNFLKHSLGWVWIFSGTCTQIFGEKCPLGGGVLPYMGYIGMRGPKGYGFSTVLVINRV